MIPSLTRCESSQQLSFLFGSALKAKFGVLHGGHIVIRRQRWKRCAVRIPEASANASDESILKGTNEREDTIF
jgi:hypothetical protein